MVEQHEVRSHAERLSEKPAELIRQILIKANIGILQGAIEEAQACQAEIAKLREEVSALRLRVQEAEGMAECMADVRQDLISKGVIPPDTAPAFVADAVIKTLTIGADTELPEAVFDATAEAIGSAYDCMRVWSAWGIGTMGPDDFASVADDGERVGEIARAAVTAFASGLMRGRPS